VLEGRGGICWARQRSHGGNGWNLVAGVEGGVPGVIHWAEWRRRKGRRGRRLGGREGRAAENHLANLRNGSSLRGVELKHPAQDRIQLEGNGENGTEKLGVFHEGTECAVIEGRALPRVASACQVDKHDTEAPYVIGR